METVKLGKRGTLVIPAKLRQRYGLSEGDLLVTEEREDGILLRPAVAVPVEIYTPERKAQFLLNNSITKEGYDEACEEIRSWGLDPAQIPFTEPDLRASLPSNEEMDKRWVEIQRNISKRTSLLKRHA